MKQLFVAESFGVSAALQRRHVINNFHNDLCSFCDNDILKELT